MKTVRIQKSSSPTPTVTVKYCDSFASKLIGLMFSKELKEDYGIILVGNKESRQNSTIHMMFVFQDLTILWLDENLVVVDKVLAKKWSPIYIPQEPAKYIVELHYSKFSEYSTGEKLIFINKP